MKKSLLAMLFAVALAVPALADGMWVSGFLGYDSTSINIKDGGNATTWSVEPELGFNLNEKWDLGLDLGYGSTNNACSYRGIELPNRTDFRTIYGAVFARYNVFSIGGFSVLAKGSIGYENSKADGDATLDTMFVAVVPVVSYSINDSWSIDAVLNFAELSYSRTTGENDFESQQFGFNLNGGSIANIGFSYHF